MYDFDEDSGEYAALEQDNADKVVDELLEPEDSAQEELFESASEVMDQAVQRIEEANLYKTIINQSLFAQGSARPEILKAVNKKFKDFAIQQLKILLGMEEEKKQAIVAAGNQFNNAEMQVLKMLIAKVLKTDPVAAIQIAPDRKPVLNQVQMNEQIISSPVPQQKPERKPRKRREAGQPMARPSGATKMKPMPTPDQQLMIYGAKENKPVISAEKTLSTGKAAQAMQQGTMAMSNIIQQLSGGNLIATDDSKPSDSF